METSQIQEAVQTAFNNGHVSVSIINVAEIVGSIIAGSIALVIVYLLNKNGFFEADKKD